VGKCEGHTVYFIENWQQGVLSYIGE